MPSIKETIASLDTIYEKPDWRERELRIFLDSYPTLRKAAFVGERYREAGEALVKAIENLGDGECFVCGEEDGDCNCDPDESDHNEIDAIIDTYRQALEQKDV